MLKLVVLSIVFTSALCRLSPTHYGENLSSIYKELHDKCRDSTGCSEECIDGVVQGQFDPTNTKAKSYLSCLWRATGILNDDFDLNHKRLAVLMPPKVSQKETGIYLSCYNPLKNTDNTVDEKIFLLTECIHRANPETYIMY